jgi:hypothetical protein
MSDFKAAAKRSIKPVTITVTVEATKLNENGTVAAFTVKSVKGPNETCKVSAPPRLGGGFFLRVESLKGIEFTSEADSAPKTKTKLF